MARLIIGFTLLVAVLLSVSVVSAQFDHDPEYAKKDTFITSCSVLDKPNTDYFLVRDIFPTVADEDCLKIVAENVSLNCLGRTIENTTLGAVGVASYADYSKIENCHVNLAAFTGVGVKLFDSDYSIVSNNMLGSNAYGIISEDSRDVVIEDNNVTLTAYHGIYLISNEGGVVRNNDANASWTYGIYLLNSEGMHILNNGAGSYPQDIRYFPAVIGIILENSHDNLIKGNFANGNEIAGIFLDRSNGNVIEQNEVSGSDRGLHILSSSFNSINGIVANENRLQGVYLKHSDGNEFEDLLLIDNDYGGISLYNSSENSFENVRANPHSSGALRVGSMSNYNLFKNIKITEFNSFYPELVLYFSEGMGGNKFINSPFKKYDFSADESRAIFRRAGKSEIRFNKGVSGSGEDLSSEIVLKHNFVGLDASVNPGLDVGAIIVLYDMPGGFDNPTIYRNSIECSEDDCKRYTSLNDEIVVFGIPGDGDYFIGEL